jgi:tRNA pseudouridine38-40 synthase
MVRNIAGTLLPIGRGDHGPEWVAELLVGRDRRKAGVTASPDGLYFQGVRYPKPFGLPEGGAAFPEDTSK